MKELDAIRGWLRRVPLSKRYSMGWATSAAALVLFLLYTQGLMRVGAWLSALIGDTAAIWILLLLFLAVWPPIASVVGQFFLGLAKPHDPEDGAGST